MAKVNNGEKVLIMVGYWIIRSGGNSGYGRALSRRQVRCGGGYPWTARGGLAYRRDDLRTAGMTRGMGEKILRL